MASVKQLDQTILKVDVTWNLRSFHPHDMKVYCLRVKNHNGK